MRLSLTVGLGQGWIVRGPLLELPPPSLPIEVLTARVAKEALTELSIRYVRERLVPEVKPCG